MDILLDPLKSSKLIMEAKIQQIPSTSLNALREAQRAHTIVNANEYDWGTLIDGCVNIDGVRVMQAMIISPD